MKGKGILVALSVLLIMGLLIGCTTPAPTTTTTTPAPTTTQQTIELKWVSGFFKETPYNNVTLKWVDMVNAESGGRLKIKYVGGPEIFPAAEQMTPLRNGVIDIVTTTPAYWSGLAPELLATSFIPAGPDKVRESGLVALLDKGLPKKLGVHWIGSLWYMTGTAYLIKPIPPVADFSGLKLRAHAIYDPLLKALGAATVTVSTAEMVSALSTGVVHGLTYPTSGAIAAGFAQIAKYRIDPGLYWLTTTETYINANSYDKLPPDLQKILTEAMIKVEKDVVAMAAKVDQDELVQQKALGMTLITLPPAEMAKVKWLGWENGVAQIQKLSPELAPEILKILEPYKPPKP